MLRRGFLILLLLPIIALADDYPSISLETILPQEQQAAIGLANQTAAQREALRRVLIDIYRAGYAEGQKASAKVAAQIPRSQSPAVIESQIDGDFKGWEGETIYKLLNGQIWQQASYHYHYHYAYSPKVLIYPSEGGYKMKVEGDNDEPIAVRLLGR